MTSSTLQRGCGADCDAETIALTHRNVAHNQFLDLRVIQDGSYPKSKVLGRMSPRILATLR